MKQVSIFIVVALIVIIEITLISTIWTFVPSVIHNPAGYLIKQVLSYALFAALGTGIIMLVVGLPVYFYLGFKGKLSGIGRINTLIFPNRH
jgi:hypothetical protein